MKIGLLTNSKFVSKYVFDLVQWTVEQNNIEINHFVIQKSDLSYNESLKKVINLFKISSLKFFLRRMIYNLIIKFELILLKSFHVHNNHLKKYNMNQFIVNYFLIKPIILKNKGFFECNDYDRKKIQDLNLDLIIQCDFDEIIGNIINIPKFGVIRFNYGNRKINKYPPGFWEVYYNNDSTTFKIQKLTEQVNEEIVIFEGKLQTQFFYLLNQAFLYTKSNYYMKEVLRKISLNKKLPEIKYKVLNQNSFFRKPTLFNNIYYLSSIFFKTVKKIFRKYLQKKRSRWGVAFSNQNWQNIILNKSIKIKNPVGCFLADPFLINKFNKDFCFVEEYNYKDNKAHIAVYELNKKNYSRLGIALKENFHISFPYVFEYQDKIYMCPETSINKDIRLYESIKFPMKWQLSKVLMNNVDAADTMIFSYNKIWWLFTNIDLSNIGDHGSELSIFYSETGPITDNWEPHPHNPIIINSNKARNGGIIVKENILYRISQKQGFELYGKEFSINEILQLDKQNYKEKEYLTVKPNFFKNIVGTHHFHANVNYTVIDFLEISKINF